VFIDDSEANVKGASACGWDAIQFVDATDLEAELISRGLLTAT
jgi:FMN phosphatase YigB (HAD superfamily)